MKNGESLVKRPIVFRKEDPFPDPNGLCVHDIYEYARNVDPCEIRDLLDMQISFNTSICEEALSDDQRLHIGKIILSENDSDPQTIAKAYAAAGCFARMNGCDMPVASLCGSGNQGISATVPVITFARKNGISKEQVYRALILSDLLTVYLIACIGKSQTVCGSILAGCAAGAAIAYLDVGDESAVARTLANALTLIYDIHCSGAKPSCTVKIAGAVEIGFLGYRMYLAGQRSEEYDKTANANIDEFVRNLYRLVSDGITESDPTVTVPVPHP
jgi:L-cysteine desulfidase